jgi:hypothetical protein
MVQPLQVVNAALTWVGSEPIGSLEEANARARTAKQHYEQCARDLLCSRPWPWARHHTGPLTPSAAAAPPGTYGGVWIVPTLDFEPLAIDSVTNDRGEPVRWDQSTEGVVIHDQIDGVPHAVLTVRVGEERWTEDFGKALTAELAAIFAAAIREDAVLATTVGQMAEVKIRRAGSRNSQARTVRKLPLGTLVRTRRI